MQKPDEQKILSSQTKEAGGRLGENVKTTLGKPVSYRLLSIPVYLAERLDELMEQETAASNRPDH